MGEQAEDHTGCDGGVVGGARRRGGWVQVVYYVGHGVMGGARSGEWGRQAWWVGQRNVVGHEMDCSMMRAVGTGNNLTWYYNVKIRTLVFDANNVYDHCLEMFYT